MSALPGAWVDTAPPVATVATPVSLEVHDAAPVTFCVVPSDIVAVAAICAWSPSGTLVGVAVTAIELTTAGPTCTAAWPTTPDWVAETLAVPCVTPRTVPVETVATAVLSDTHVAVDVRPRVVRSEEVPVAVSDVRVPLA